MTELKTQDNKPVSRFAFGTMQFGGTADAHTSAALFDDCIAAGINHFDTAHLYTGGNAETILGQRAAAHATPLYIATKIGYDAPDNLGALRDQFDLSRTRLGMDQIDLLYLHRFNPNLSLRAQIGLLAGMQDAGEIRHIGLSNCAAWQVMKLQSIAAEFGTKIDVVQPMYSLVKRQAEVEILPMCQSENITPVPYSPLGGGLLTGKYHDPTTGGRLTDDPRYAARYGQNWMHEAASGLRDIAQDLALHPASVAVAWAARHPANPMPILSARSPEQLAPSLAGMTYEMSDALYAKITALTPTPAPATDRIEENG